MYINWDTQTNHVILLKWYKLENIITYLHGVRHYIITTRGKFSESHIPKRIEDKAPVGHERRFPETENWLCEGIGEWSLKFDMLYQALSVSLSPNRLEREYPHYKTQGDIECYCLKVINDLLHLFASPEPGQVVRRLTFEQKYGVLWEEKPEKIKRLDVKTVLSMENEDMENHDNR